MYRNILIGTDGSELATKALTQGLALAKSINAKVTVVTVTEMWSVGEMVTAANLAGMSQPNPMQKYEADVQALANRILEDAQRRAKVAGVACEGVHVPDSTPAEGILRTAEQRDCDLIIVSTHARTGLARLVIGSQAANVIAKAKVPVMVCR